MKRLILGLTAACTGLLATTSQAQSPERPPNVVLILADDMGWMDMGAYGSTYYETPHLDAFAAQGMRFTDAYAANPLCSPTRASILTGLDPARIGLTTPAGHVEAEVFSATVANRGPAFKANDSTSATRLANDFLTLGEVFKAQGYATGFFGKWHLGRDPYIPQNQGFDVVVGGGPYPGPPGGFFAPWPEPTLPDRPAGSHITDATTDAALEWMGQVRDEPFLMCYWLWDVHAPFQAKPELIQRFGDQLTPDDPQQCPTMAGMLSTMDTNLGRLFYLLEQLDLDEHTIVIFTSDNGGNMYNWVDEAHGQVRPTNNAPLQGGKAMIYEGGIRVPLLVRWPGTVEAGSESDALVSTVDLLPTLLDAAEIEMPREIRPDGASYLPVLTGDADAARETYVCHFPHYVSNPQYEGYLNVPSTAVRQGDWKLIRFYFDNADGSGHRYELYNLAEDPGESDNQYAARRALAAELEAAMDEYLAEVNAVLPQQNPRYGQADNAPPAADDRVAVGGWMPSANGSTALSLAEGNLLVSARGDDPWIACREMPVGARGALRATVRMRSDAVGETQLFFAVQGMPAFAAARRVVLGADTVEPDADGYRTLVYDFTAQAPLVGLRFDPIRTSTQTFEIESVTLQTRSGQTLQTWSFDG